MPNVPTKGLLESYVTIDVQCDQWCHKWPLESKVTIQMTTLTVTFAKVTIQITCDDSDETPHSEPSHWAQIRIQSRSRNNFAIRCPNVMIQKPLFSAHQALRNETKCWNKQWSVRGPYMYYKCTARVNLVRSGWIFYHRVNALRWAQWWSQIDQIRSGWYRSATAQPAIAVVKNWSADAENGVIG
jgi:hypothetical protein